MSGGLPAWVTVVSLSLNAWFSSGVMLILIPEWACSKALAMLA